MTRGKEYVFISMDILFIDKYRVRILIKKYLTESIYVFYNFGEIIIASVNLPPKGAFLLRMIRRGQYC